MLAIDYNDIGVKIGTVALAIWGVIQAGRASRQSKQATQQSNEAKTVASNNVEVLRPTDKPTLYDSVQQLQSSVSELSTIIRSHRASQLEEAQDIKETVRDLGKEFQRQMDEMKGRITSLEGSVRDTKALEHRVETIETSLRLLVGPAPRG